MAARQGEADDTVGYGRMLLNMCMALLLLVVPFLWRVPSFVVHGLLPLVFRYCICLVPHVGY